MPRGIPETTFCAFHCNSCDSHFTSLEAFDHHLNRLTDGRVSCLDPTRIKDQLGGLRYDPHRGCCRISQGRDAPREGVWVYSKTRLGDEP